MTTPSRSGSYSGPYRGLAAVVLLACVFALGSSSNAARADDPEHYIDRLELRLADTSRPTKTEGRLFLRPNNEHSVTLSFYNPYPIAKRIKVSLFDGDKENRLLGRSELVEVASKASQVISFKSAVAPPTATAPAAAGGEFIALKGPTFGLNVQVEDSDGHSFVRPLSIVVLEPTSYVQATCKYDDKKQKLEANVEPRAGEFAGPDCPVRLVLSPERIPNLDSGALKGTFDGTIAKDRSAHMIVDRLVASEDDGASQVSLTVDNYPRAFVFEGSLIPGGGRDLQPIRGGTPRVLISAPHYTKPLEATPLDVRVDLDNAPADCQVQLWVDQNGTLEDKEYALRETRFGDRDRRVSVNVAGPQGALVFKSTVQDWLLKVNANGKNSGRIGLQVRVLDSKGTELRLLPWNGRGDANYYSRAETTVDSTRPEGKFEGWRPEATRGSELKVKLKAEDAESKIKEVRFFIGELTDDRKIPAGKAVQTVKAANADGFYTASFKLPDEKKKVPVTAVFVNGVDLEGSATEMVNLIDPVDPNATKPTTGKITGTIEVGDTAQPGQEVYLLDAARKEVKDSVKTNDKGEYTFTDVPPGLYQIYVYKKSSRESGQDSAKVKAGETTTVSLRLKRGG